MELLKIQHQDFDMFIECTKFDGIWEKAKRNVGEENLTSSYTWSEGVVSVQRLPEDKEPHAINYGEAAPAIFFDNADYPIWVEFTNPKVTSAQFGSMLQSDNERFTFRKRNKILSGFLNYGNDIGRSEIHIIYNIEEQVRTFTFGFEVLSTKLNYHEHWKQIVEDIEAEYRMLSLDYMKRTFHGFSLNKEGDRPDIVWWSVFQGEQEMFIKAVRSIIERPRHRLHNISTFQRADKLHRVTSNIENELAEHRREPAHLYHVEEQIPSNDTQENRFLKHALAEITSKYETLKSRIEAIRNTSDSMRHEMGTKLATMKQLQHSPFFRTVGRFKGLTQESLILQKASGYSQVYRTWNLLRRAYSLNDGIYRLQSKDIATLYEIWCFIEVSHIVKEQLGIDTEVDHRNRMEMNGVFTWELGKGEHSRILFKKDNVALAELVYNPKHTEKENDSISMENIYVPTVAQKPDIVLQLTKDDMQKGMKMTYLFDAKYRIDGRDSKGVDTPPENAINQMHRYRDAIYYKDRGSEELKKEVIGGYILFPGDGAPADVEVSHFYRTIDEVNIGAFPLRPRDKRNRVLLENFIKGLVDNAATELLADSIPQKGMFYSNTEPKEPTYMILTIDDNVNTDVDGILSGKSSTIVMGRKGMEETRDIQSVRYIVPVINGSHITGYYKVKSARWTELPEEEYSIRITFDVAEWTQLDVPAKFGLVRFAYRGVCKTKEEFFRHCKEQAVKPKASDTP